MRHRFHEFFRVQAGNQAGIEFCDAGNRQDFAVFQQRETAIEQVAIDQIAGLFDGVRLLSPQVEKAGGKFLPVEAEFRNLGEPFDDCAPGLPLEVEPEFPFVVGPQLQFVGVGGRLREFRPGDGLGRRQAAGSVFGSWPNALVTDRQSAKQAIIGPGSPEQIRSVMKRMILGSRERRTGQASQGNAPKDGPDGSKPVFRAGIRANRHPLGGFSRCRSGCGTSSGLGKAQRLGRV